MLKTILRREHKNRWERRVAISPTAAGQLKSQGFQLDVESSEDRIYTDATYEAEDLQITDTPHLHQLVLVDNHKGSTDTLVVAKANPSNDNGCVDRNYPRWRRSQPTPYYY